MTLPGGAGIPNPGDFGPNDGDIQGNGKGAGAEQPGEGQHGKPVGQGTGWWEDDSLDEIGGDGSDDDIQNIAAQAANDAINLMFASASNPGMSVLANMISDEIQSQAENIAEAEGADGADMDAMLERIAEVHSPGTARSCMSESVANAFDILQKAADDIAQHEAAEGG
jgi:hypothetical protein